MNKFVVNLDRCKDRMKYFDKSFKRWSAVDGADLKDDNPVLSKMISYHNISAKQHRAKCGCFISHINLLQHIINNKLNNVLVLEDDAEMVNPLPDPLPEEFTYLGGFFSGKHFSDVEVSNRVGIWDVPLDSKLLMTLSYYIPQWEAAKFIYDSIMSQKRYRAIDVILNNIHFTKSRKKGFTFCGNAGRLQHISLLVLAIKAYCEAGGSLEFVFAGGGLYSRELELLATQFENVQYLGKVSPITAAELNTDYTWSLLPIEDKVTKFAFPSKASSYVMSDANILAICGEETSVGKWVVKNGLGLTVKSNINEIVSVFFDIENGKYENYFDSTRRSILKEKLNFDFYVKALKRKILS